MMDARKQRVRFGSKIMVFPPQQPQQLSNSSHHRRGVKGSGSGDSAVQRRSLFWSANELNGILNEAKKTTDSIQVERFQIIETIEEVYNEVVNLERCEAQSDISAKDISQHAAQLQAWCRSGVERGLETFVSRKQDACRQDAINDARELVVDMCMLEEDAESIAEAYQKRTCGCACFARVVGEADAMAARDEFDASKDELKKQEASLVVAKRPDLKKSSRLLRTLSAVVLRRSQPQAKATASHPIAPGEMAGPAIAQ